MEIWCDGGVNRFCVVDSEGEVKVIKDKGTPNEQEYKAMIYALEKAKDGDTIYADSQLVVNQLTKGWKVKAANLYPFYVKALKILTYKQVNIVWIPRDSNRAGWILE